ncbi:MAG TPA: hypothetical protein VLH85_01940 [Levilinea sp.]|nr:hypothetical protein [Levilinea sp.]
MIDLEKLEQDWADGRAVNPKNVRALMHEVRRLMAENNALQANLDNLCSCLKPTIDGICQALEIAKAARTQSMTCSKTSTWTTTASEIKIPF